MATFSNQSKNTSTIANQAFSGASITWAETEPATWGDVDGTWGNPLLYINQSKNSSSITNETKN